MSDYDPPATVGIGTQLWIYDRHYETRHSSRSVGDFASGWRGHEIVGETRVSWILRPFGASGDYADKKLPKKRLALPNHARLRWSLDGIAAEYADALWLQKNRYPISEAVRRIDVPTLREVAALIGYEEAK